MAQSHLISLSPGGGPPSSTNYWDQIHARERANEEAQVSPQVTVDPGNALGWL